MTFKAVWSPYISLLLLYLFCISRLCVILVTNVFRHLSHLSLEHIPVVYFYAKKISHILECSNIKLIGGT